MGDKLFASLMRFLYLILAFAVALPAQEPITPQHPKVSLALPSGIDSHTAQINYFMTGPFGGTGMFGMPEKDKTGYEIDASVEGRPARNVKVIAWFPGCEIVTLAISIDSERIDRQLPCKSLGSADLKGEIFPVDMINDSMEVDVSYLGLWSHEFFGIADGPVLQIQIGKITPDANGAFQIKLPDLATQERMSDGEFQFILREKTTGNIVAFLRPMDDPKNRHDVKVAHEYPNPVRFTAEQR